LVPATGETVFSNFCKKGWVLLASGQFLVIIAIGYQALVKTAKNRFPDGGKNRFRPSPE